MNGPNAEGLLKGRGIVLLLLDFVERRAGSGEAATGEIPGQVGVGGRKVDR